jgi:hypothetical protein
MNDLQAFTEPTMLELNPYLNQIEDLKERALSLRGYL